MFDKKARTISGHVILWIPKFIFLIIAFLSVIFLIRLLVLVNVDATEAEARVMANRIYYSPNAISFYDSQLGRAYPGIIDFEKFKKLQTPGANELDSRVLTYGESNSLIAAKLELKNLETNSDEMVFYNKENYDFWEPRILSTVTGGSGSVKSYEEQRFVLLKIGENLQKGMLKIKIIVRK